MVPENAVVLAILLLYHCHKVQRGMEVEEIELQAKRTWVTKAGGS